MKKKFTAIIEKRDMWYVGYVEDLPGVNTQGKTLKEVSDNLKEAIALVLETNRDLMSGETGSKVYRKTITVEI